MNLSLFINTAEPDPRLALVTSKSDMTRRPLPVFTLGDKINLSIYLVDGAGAIDAKSGAAAYAPYLAIGLPGHDAAADVSSFTSVLSGDYHWTAVLDLSADAMILYVRSAVRQALALSFATVHASEGQATWLAVDASVADQIGAPATSSAMVPVAFVPRPDIVALTGGAATNLDGIDDTLLPTGYVVLLSYGGVPQTFQITAGTAATDTAATPVTVRVKNYNASTNARYWLQLM